MYRKELDSLVKWNESAKRKPLILMGARQVGKTWLMNEFAKTHYPDETVRIDLQKHETLQKQIDISDLEPKGLIDLIQAFTGKVITPGKTQLIIDEIQESPKALNALKYYNTKAKSLKTYRDLFSPPYAIRTSLAPHGDGALTKDIPLYAFGSQLPRLLGI